MLSGNSLPKNIWAQKSWSKRKMEKLLKMTSKFVFIIKCYVSIERKIMGWTGLKARLQEWENKYIIFLRNVLRRS